MRTGLTAAAAALFAAGSLVSAAGGSTSPAASVATNASGGGPAVSPAGAAAPGNVPAGGLVLAVPHSVTVSLTPTGCAPASVEVPAGPVSFTVGNAATPGVSEAELAGPDGGVLAEAEGVGPGVSGGFSVTLRPGSYTLSCQASAGAATPMRVTATAAQRRTLTAAQAQTHRLLQSAASGYSAYVRTEVAALSTTTRSFAAAVRAGDVALAKTRYLDARVHYERIESVAETFGQLDALIDERADAVPAGRAWSGFHRLEKALWVGGSLADVAPVADELTLAVSNLQVVVDRTVLEPAQLADGAAALLTEVGATKITGEEERYSHADAVDLAANVAGAAEAATELGPGLARLDPGIADLLQRRFASLAQVVAAIPPAARTDWRRADPALRQQLSAAVDAAAAPLTTVAAEVAAA